MMAPAAAAAVPEAPPGSPAAQTDRAADEPPMPAWPLLGPVTSGFGPRGSGMHTGLDIDGDTGDRVVAVLPGHVVHAGTYFGYGETVIVDHGDGLGSLYGHLSRIDVEIGDFLERGDHLGLVGCSGECTGDHLHFEIRIEAEPVDPATYLKRRVARGSEARPREPLVHVFGPAL